MINLIELLPNDKKSTSFGLYKDLLSQSNTSSWFQEQVMKIKLKLNILVMFIHLLVVQDLMFQLVQRLFYLQKNVKAALTKAKELEIKIPSNHL